MLQSKLKKQPNQFVSAAICFGGNFIKLCRNIVLDPNGKGLIPIFALGMDHQLICHKKAPFLLFYFKIAERDVICYNICYNINITGGRYAGL